jgi:hypothetical protein
MKLLTVIAVVLFLIGCSRGLSPYQAANKGGLKCGKNHIK